MTNRQRQDGGLWLCRAPARPGPGAGSREALCLHLSEGALWLGVADCGDAIPAGALRGAGAVDAFLVACQREARALGRAEELATRLEEAAFVAALAGRLGPQVQALARAARQLVLACLTDEDPWRLLERARGERRELLRQGRRQLETHGSRQAWRGGSERLLRSGLERGRRAARSTQHSGPGGVGGRDGGSTGEGGPRCTPW